MTKRRALEICRDLWLWLAENPEELKDNWPEWDFNEGYVGLCINECPCCEYTGVTGSDDDCSKCPLMAIWDYSHLENPCMHFESPYIQWGSALIDSEKKKYALIIANGAIAELEKMKVREVK